MKCITEIALLLMVSAGLALLLNELSPVGIPLVGQWDLSKGVVRADANVDDQVIRFEIDNIDLAKKAHDQGNTPIE